MKLKFKDLLHAFLDETHYIWTLPKKNEIKTDLQNLITMIRHRDRLDRMRKLLSKVKAALDGEKANELIPLHEALLSEVVLDESGHQLAELYNIDDYPTWQVFECSKRISLRP